MANIERNYLRTDGMNDVELALKFYDDFNFLNPGDPKGPTFFGKIISNETFNEWIDSLGFDFTGDHGWITAEGKTAWSGYRSTVRRYLKNGVMDPEYGLKVDCGAYEPFVLKVNLFGVDLKIVEYSDHVVDSAMELATKRQKTIKQQSKDLKKGFKAMTDVYGVSDLKVDLQEKLIDSQNEMRLHIEKAFDEIYRKTVKDTADLIAESRKAVKQITETANQLAV